MKRILTFVFALAIAGAPAAASAKVAIELVNLRVIAMTQSVGCAAHAPGVVYCDLQGVPSSKRVTIEAMGSTPLSRCKVQLKKSAPGSSMPYELVVINQNLIKCHVQWVSSSYARVVIVP